MRQSRGIARVRRLLFILALCAASWALAVTLSGGFVLTLGGTRISSHAPLNPALIALLATALACALSPLGFRGGLAADWDRMRRFDFRWATRIPEPPNGLPQTLAAVVCVLVVSLGMTKAAFVAGGADSYGYVSESRLWLGGSLHTGQELLREFSPIVPSQALVPIGYTLAPAGGAMVPIYSPGLPLVMSVFERVGGPRAVYYVVPLMAGMTVWAAYLLASQLIGAWGGLTTAVLVATSPAFLFMLTAAPMSDIPVTAWWTLTLALLPFRGRWPALGAGLATGAAILTRPNLVLLAVVPGVWMLWHAAGRRSPLALQRILLFGAGALPGCLSVGVINARLFGSPTLSGYGPLENYYAWRYLWANLARYPRWIVESEGVLVLFALAGPFVIWRLVRPGMSQRDARALVVMAIAFAMAAFASYAFYLPFDAWWYLRFLLPAFPPLLLLTSAGIIGVSARVWPRGRGLITALLVAFIASHAVTYARERSIFNTGGEMKYRFVGEYIAARLPERAVIFSMQHSGSARFYSGRTTVRYDLLPPDALDSTVAGLRQRGYHPYVLLEEWEEKEFRSRFERTSPLAALDWEPKTLFRLGTIRIYDLADPQRDRASTETRTEVVE